MSKGGKEDRFLSYLEGSNPNEAHKFSFVLENVKTSGTSNEERASEHFCCLEGESFDFLYQLFAENGDITDYDSDYQKIKKALTERFAAVDSLEDVIRNAMSAFISFGDLNRSL